MSPETETTPRTPAPSPSRARRRRWLVPALLVGAVVVGVGLWLTQPWLLLVDTVADEALPVTVAPADDADAADDAPADGAGAGDTAGEASSGATDADATGAGGTVEDTAGEDAAGEDTAGETDGSAAPAAAGDTDAAAPSGDGADAGDEPAADDAAEAEPAGPVVLSSGSFISRDHGTSGTVAIVELEDGSRVLTIEDLDTDNGPDLFVYLDDDAADAPEGDFDDGINLGRLRANQGDLVYEIPADLDLTSVASVGIWCDRFSSLFGAADLAPAA